MPDDMQSLLKNARRKNRLALTTVVAVVVFFYSSSRSGGYGWYGVTVLSGIVFAGSMFELLALRLGSLLHDLRAPKKR